MYGHGPQRVRPCMAAQQLSSVPTVRRARRRSIAPICAAIALTVSASACAGDDDTSDDLDSAVDDVEAEVEDVGDEVADAADEAGEDAVELAVRNLASLYGQDEFTDAGHPIEGDLTCTADATDALDAVEIGCVGETEAGLSASLTGTTAEFPGESLTELEGDFIGSVDGEEVFRTDTLG